MFAFRKLLNPHQLAKPGGGFLFWTLLVTVFTPVMMGQSQSSAQIEQGLRNGLVPSLGAKKAGTTRVCVLQPTVEFGQTNSSVTTTEPLRNLIMQYLNGPKLEPVPLFAMLPGQVSDEANRKDCDYTISTSLIQQSKASGLGMLRKAMPFVAMVPVVGAVARIGTVAATGATAVTAASAGKADLSGVVKAKSEMTLKYQVVSSATSSPVLADSAKAKAKSDGDDIITPLVIQADSAIVAKLSKKEVN